MPSGRSVTYLLKFYDSLCLKNSIMLHDQLGIWRLKSETHSGYLLHFQNKLRLVKESLLQILSFAASKKIDKIPNVPDFTSENSLNSRHSGAKFSVVSHHCIIALPLCTLYSQRRNWNSVFIPRVLY